MRIYNNFITISQGITMQALTELLLQIALILYIFDFLVSEFLGLVLFLHKTIKEHYASY